MVIFQIKNPKTEDSNSETFAQILANFANQSPLSFVKRHLLGKKDNKLVLEILFAKNSIYFFLICDDHLASYFTSQIASYYPKAEVLRVKDYLPQLIKLPALRAGRPSLSIGQLVLKHPYYYPLQTYKMFKNTDPLASVLSTLAKSFTLKAALVQIVLVPAGSKWQTAAQSFIDKGLTDAESGRRKSLPSESAIKTKIASQGLKTGIRLATRAESAPQAERNLQDLAGTFGVFSRGDGNALALKKTGSWSKKKLLRSILHRTPYGIPRFQILNTEEVATMFHPPGKEIAAVKNISWGGQMLSEAPESLPVQEVQEGQAFLNFFARTEFKNRMTTFGIKSKDRRRHMYLIGKTGTGKTTLIANMAINDMRNGQGVAVIDPHGDLCNILLDYIPKNRINDVAYLDPSDTSFPFHLNPLELPKNAGKTQSELVASGIVSIFHKLYHYSWGPRLEYILRNALLTLSHVPNSTLVDIPPLLSDTAFRRKIVNKLNDRVLINYWNSEFNNMSERLKSEAISPILNKVGQFVASPMIRNIIGHPRSTINLSEMMDKGKIMIVNLSQGKLGEDNASLLGSMFITKIQLSAMARAYKSEEQRRDFYLYVDEFQNFATTSFIKILSEARKYRLNLILANQYIGQIDEGVRKAIFGNVGTLLSFLVGAEDGRILSFEFGESYEQKDFVSLDNFQLLLKMAIDGKTSDPFYAVSLPLPKAKNKNREKVIRVSRERYAKSSTKP